MYEKGIGVESSLSKAKYWLKKLANDGDKRAEKILKTIN
jgi:TPR repeat protein